MAPMETSFFIKTPMQAQNSKPKNNQHNNEQKLPIGSIKVLFSLKQYKKTADKSKAERKHTTEAYEDNQRTRVKCSNPLHPRKIKNANVQTEIYKMPRVSVIIERKKSTIRLFFKRHIQKTNKTR